MPTVEDILMAKGPDVIVIEPSATVFEAARLMADGRVGSVIVRQDGRVAGIFTERDLLQRVVAAGKDPARVTLAEVMSSPVRSCRLSDDVADCAKMLRESNIRHLAVIEDDALVGVVGLRDVLQMQAGAK